MSSMGPVPVTGASGYVGGRLVEHLRGLGVSVRAAGRRPQLLQDRWPGIRAVEMDVVDAGTIAPATEGVRVADYLVHAMAEGEAGFEERDRVAARNFAEAARGSGVETIVYLGGVGGEAEQLSPHLASRQETGLVLAEYGPAVLEFRAGW